jgi:hypothetical protein
MHSLTHPTTTASRLAIQGMVLDTISSRSANPMFLDDMIHNKYSSLDQVLEGNPELVTQMTSVFYEWALLIHKANTVKHEEVFRNIMTWDKNAIDLYGPKYEAAEMERDIHKWYTCLTRPSEEEQGGLANLVRRIEARLVELMLLNLEKYHQELCVSSVFKCIFMTSNNHMGSTWYTAQEGDFVVLLCWSRLPAILGPIQRTRLTNHERRDEAGHYLLIGFAHVHEYLDCWKWNLPTNSLKDFILV